MNWFMNKYFLIIILATWIRIPGTTAQEAGRLGFSELIDKAELAIETSDTANAVPLLREIVARAGALDDKGAQKSVQVARLQLASSLIQLGQWDDAEEFANQYLANEPAREVESALRVLCEANLQQKDWASLQTYADRLVQEVTRLKGKGSANSYLLHAYFNNKKYTKALALIPQLLKWLDTPEQILATRCLQLQCLIETNQMDQLMTTLPDLFRGGNRMDLTLNLTLLRIGDGLFDRQEYRKALAVYRQILPWANPRKPEVSAKTVASEEGPGAITDISKTMKSMEHGSEYGLHIFYRTAQSYAEIKRYWEGITLFDQIYQDHKDSNEGKASYMQKVLMLFDIGADEEAVAACLQYLDEGRSGIHSRMICTQLAQHYLNSEQFDKVLALSRYVNNWAPPSDQEQRDQAVNLLYIFAFVHFQQQSFDMAEPAFQRVIAYAPKSERSMDSAYWIGMCHLMKQDYEKADASFITYRQTWPQGEYASASLFRSGVCHFGQEDYEGAKAAFKQFINDYEHDALMPEALTMYGDLLGGDGAFDEAIENYNRAVKIVHGRFQIEADPKMKSAVVNAATYASIQAAKTLEQDAEFYASNKNGAVSDIKYGEIVELMQKYMDLFGAYADLSQGIFWIGKAQMAQGESMKAVNAYLDAVIKYGSDPKEEGVASILFDLADIVNNSVTSEQRTQVVTAIKKARRQAESPVLQIRLDVLAAELDGTQALLGQKLLHNGFNLADVPPTGLSIICSAMLEYNQLGRAQEIFDFFQENYDSSPYMVQAYHLLGSKFFQQEKFDEAYEMAIDALGYYGASEYTGWAQIMKGQIETARGQYDEAAKSFNGIFGVRAWRGSISAQAMFLMAQSWELQGNLEKAFAFYQRTYLLYKAYDEGKWAADAYLRSAEILNKMGREDAARNTYRAMLYDTYVQNLPQADKAKELLGPEETAALLAGITNSLGTVSIKEAQ